MRDIGDLAKVMGESISADLCKLHPDFQVQFLMANMLFSIEELRLRMGEDHLIKGLQIAIGDLERFKTESKEGTKH